MANHFGQYPIDSLTGVYDRTILKDALDALLDCARQQRESVALLLLDVDNFKSINDAFGHARGDQVLRELATRLRGLSRENDLVVRYGGDEFILILPKTKKTQAQRIAQRLLEGVRKPPFQGDTPLSVSISIGVAAFPEDGETPEDLFDCADRRHYTAKRIGRGRVVANDPLSLDTLEFDNFQRLIERAQQLEALYRFLGDLSEQQRGVFTISGPPGVGKARFLIEAEKAGQLLGYTIIPIRGLPGLRTRVYGALFESLQSLPKLNSLPTSAQEITAAIEQLACRTGQNALLFTIDNLPEIDHATIHLLQEILASPNIETIGLINTTNAEGYVRSVPFETSLTESVRLEPLSAEGVHIFLRNVLKWEPPKQFSHWMSERTGGLPAHIQKELSALVEDQWLQKTGDGWELHPQYAHLPPLKDSLPPVNLPVPSNSFVGRVQALQQIKASLETQRLITIVGPGGIGKTRLGIQVAAEMSERFSDGVFFVPLASVPGPEHLEAAITSSLQLAFSGTEPLREQLLAALRPREMLIVMDNFEHLLDGVELLVEILRHAPRIHMIVTSRERLNLLAEQVFELQGLDYPAEENHLESLEQFSAAHLFLLRMRRNASVFSNAGCEASIIARICRLVGGMPLGIELAAAWTGVLSCHQILEQLETNLDFFGASEVPTLFYEGPHSVRAVFDYFWNLLSEDEQRVVRQLSVFRGGFTSQAAGEVAGASLFFLSALVDRSFLYIESGGKFTLHELLLQYAGEKLAQHPEDLQTTRRAHARYFSSLLAKQISELQSPRQLQAAATIEAEIDNIRAAWEWTARHGEFACFAQGLDTLCLFYDMRNRFQEGRELFDWALNILQSDNQQAWLWARVAARSAFFHRRLGNFKHSYELLESAIEIARQHHDRRLLAFANGQKGYVLMRLGDLLEAKKVLQESLQLWYELGDIWWQAITNSYLGMVTETNHEYQFAQTCYYEGMAKFEQLGDQRGVAFIKNNLGIALELSGDIEQAQTLYLESLEVFRSLGESWAMILPLSNLGDVAVKLQDYQAARTHYQEALRLALELQTASKIMMLFYSFAELLVAEGRINEAQEILLLTHRHPKTDAIFRKRTRTLAGKIGLSLPEQPTSPPDHKEVQALARRLLRL